LALFLRLGTLVEVIFQEKKFALRRNITTLNGTFARTAMKITVVIKIPVKMMLLDPL